MTDDKKTTPTQSEQAGAKESNPYIQLAIFTMALIVLAVFAFQNPRVARSIAMVALGFGGVVMIHELGHFLVAKLGGIKVEEIGRASCRVRV